MITGILKSIAVAILLGPMSSSDDRWTHQFIAKALQGDVAAGLAATPDVSSETDYRAHVRARFEQPFVASVPGDPVERALIAFQRYWHAALLEPDRREALEHRLYAEIADITGRPDDLGDFGRLKELLRGMGIYTQLGRTAPLLDIFAWKTERRVPYAVELPESTQDVTVVFMDDVISWGWSHYATLGKAYAGGWVGSEELYCFARDYDVNTEKFTVSYLKHEAQHFLDLRNFPGMVQEDLEYRAKLVELIYAEQSLEHLLQVFSSQGDQHGGSPHARANWQVISDVADHLGVGRDGLGMVDDASLQDAARQLLRKDTERRTVSYVR